MKLSSALFCTALAVSLVTDAAEVSERFRHQTIDDAISIGYGLAVADVNGDQKTDILLVDKEEIVWYENPAWKKHLMLGKVTERDNVCIAAQDINGDGKAEVAIGAEWNPGDTENSGAVFYLIPSQDRTQKWTPVKLHHEPTVHRMAWVNNQLVVAPLHGRGNKGGQGEGVKLLEYTMSGKPEGVWHTRVMEDSMHMTHNLDAVQWDNDDSEEVLYCGREGVMLLDKQPDGNWTATKLITDDKNQGFPGAGEVRGGKLKDKRVIATVEPMHGNNAVIYTPEDEGWKRQVLDDSLADGHAVAFGDLLGKGMDQVVFGWRGKNKDGKVGIKMFVPNSAEGKQWDEVWIDDNQMACEDLKLTDLNNDGHLDIVAAGRASKNVKIYWNKGKD